MCAIKMKKIRDIRNLQDVIAMTIYTKYKLSICVRRSVRIMCGRQWKHLFIVRT